MKRKVTYGYMNGETRVLKNSHVNDVFKRAFMHLNLTQIRVSSNTIIPSWCRRYFREFPAGLMQLIEKATFITSSKASGKYKGQFTKINCPT
jgi:hypothetical protein